MADLTPEQIIRIERAELAARRANPRGISTAEMEREARASRVPSGPVRQPPSAQYIDPAEQAKLDAMTRAYNRDEYTSKIPGYKKGGVVKESKAESRKEMAADKKQDVKLIKKAFKEHDAQEHKGGKGTKLSLCKGGNVKKMAAGGMAMKETMGPRTMAKDVEAGSNKLIKFGQSAVQKRGLTRGKNLGDSGPTMGIMGGGMKKGGNVKKMAAGGSASKRADGIAQKGKTRGKYC